MSWNDFNEKLRELWLSISNYYDEALDPEENLKAEEKALKLMEELTIELENK